MAGVEDAKDAALHSLGVDPGKVSIDDLEALDTLLEKIIGDPAQGISRVVYFRVAAAVADDVWAAVMAGISNIGVAYNTEVSVSALWEGAADHEPVVDITTKDAAGGDPEPVK